MGATIIFFISTAMFYGFTAYVVIKYGILDSWSQVFFTLEKKGGYWMALMVINAFLMGALFFELTEGYWFQFMGLFTAIPLAFVGLAPDFKTKHLNERQVHFIAAFISAFGSLLMLIFVSIWIESTVILYIPIFAFVAWIGYLLNDRRNLTWHAEFACFNWTYATYLVLLVLYLQKRILLV